MVLSWLFDAHVKESRNYTVNEGILQGRNTYITVKYINFQLAFTCKQRKAVGSAGQGWETLTSEYWRTCVEFYFLVLSASIVVQSTPTSRHCAWSGRAMSRNLLFSSTASSKPTHNHPQIKTLFLDCFAHLLVGVLCHAASRIKIEIICRHCNSSLCGMP